MPIPTTVTDLSTVANNNSPAGSESPTDGDNYIRALSSIIRQEHDAFAGSASGTAGQGAGAIFYNTAATYATATVGYWLSRFGDADGTGGAELIGFIQAGTGSVERSAQDKMRERVSLDDKGGIADGATSNSTALSNALALLSDGGTIDLGPGDYLIDSTFTNTTNGITLRGVNGTAIWNGVTTVYKGGTRIIKKSTMTTEAIKNTGIGFSMENIAVVGNSGNTGDGIYLEDGQSARLVNVSVAGVGGNGIRIGAKTGQTGNVNGWQLTNVTSQYNGGKGVYIYDESASGGPNANAGTAHGLNVAGNTDDGLHIENGQFNTFTGLLSQQNTGYGVKLVGSASISLYATFVGGDIEANTAGQWSIGADAKHFVYVGASTSAPTSDPQTYFATVVTGQKVASRSLQFSSSTSTMDRFDSTTWTPSFTGLTVVNGTGGATYSGTYRLIGDFVFWTIKITTTGTCTTESTAGTTYVSAPSGTIAASATLSASNEATYADLGTCLAYSGNNRLYMPTWSAQTGNIVISGSYPIS